MVLLCKSRTVVHDSRGNEVRKSTLPGPRKKFTRYRKEQVVLAVINGIATLEEVCARYRMSTEEFEGWRKSYERGGVNALRLNRLPGKAVYEKSTKKDTP